MVLFLNLHVFRVLVHYLKKKVFCKAMTYWGAEAKIFWFISGIFVDLYNKTVRLKQKYV